MEPCACADIAHRCAGERRCRRRTVAEMGRGRGWVGEGEVGGWERRRLEWVLPNEKGAWGREGSTLCVRPRAVALHIISGV